MQIKDEGALTFPGKLNGDPNRRSRDKYCHFHRDHGHDTADCYDLKQQIEALINQGKLQKFVSKEKADPAPLKHPPRRDNDSPRPPVGDIRMIVGGMANRPSKRARKTYLRMVQNVQLTGPVQNVARRESPVIEFSEEDAQRLHYPHDDALVVSLQLGRHLVLPGIPADENQQGTTGSNERPTCRFWRDKGVPAGRDHVGCDSRRLPPANHKGRIVPRG
nr:uncharacterized protein LOC112039031 [Quercus suber]